LSDFFHGLDDFSVELAREDVPLSASPQSSPDEVLGFVSAENQEPRHGCQLRKAAARERKLAVLSTRLRNNDVWLERLGSAQGPRVFRAAVNAPSFLGLEQCPDSRAIQISTA
jgi:hypothetical protein